MHNLSMVQALKVWTELEKAYRGESSYAERTCEIYCFEMMTHHPAIHANDDVETRVCQQVRKSFLALLTLFDEVHEDALIYIDGLEYFVALRDDRPLEMHRYHVMIKRSSRGN